VWIFGDQRISNDQLIAMIEARVAEIMAALPTETAKLRYVADHYRRAYYARLWSTEPLVRTLEQKVEGQAAVSVVRALGW